MESPPPPPTPELDTRNFDLKKKRTDPDSEIGDTFEKEPIWVENDTIWCKKTDLIWLVIRAFDDAQFLVRRREGSFQKEWKIMN